MKNDLDLTFYKKYTTFAFEFLIKMTDFCL
jgi:hypothetical protein